MLRTEEKAESCPTALVLVGTGKIESQEVSRRTYHSVKSNTVKQGQLVGKSAGLVIEWLRVLILAGAAGEFSSPELALCADSYSVSFHARVTAAACKRPR